MSETTRIDIRRVASPPEAPAGAVAIGPAVDIVADNAVVNAEVALPLSPDVIGNNGEKDFYIAVYNEAMEVWVPLPTQFAPEAMQATAIAPHFSTYSAFSYKPDFSVVGDAARWTGQKAGNAAHDIYGGVKNMVAGIASGLNSVFQGGELKKPNCDNRTPGWEVQSSAVETSGCVTDGGAEVRIGNSYRVPFIVAAPKLELVSTDDDLELDLISYMMKTINASSGYGSISKRNTTILGIPDTQRVEGSRLDMMLQPDLLGTALDVVIGMMSFLPGKKELTKQVDTRFVSTVWEMRGSQKAFSELVIDIRQSATVNLGKSKEMDALNRFFDAVSCVQNSINGGRGAISSGEAEQAARAIIDIAKDCTGFALEAADSSFKAVWDQLKGALDGFQAVRSTSDALKLGFTHLSGEIDMYALKEPPVVHLGVSQGGLTEGFGLERPAEIFLGGASDTGRVTGIVWSSWGNDYAQGSGLAAYVAPGQPNASAVRRMATVVAFEPSDCGGERAYRKLKWFFPQYGESLADYPPFDICEPL